MPQGFWDRHQWVATELSGRIALLSLKYASDQMDPLLLFTSMVAQTTVLYMYKIMNSMLPVTAENQAAVSDYQRCSLVAAGAMVTLTKTVVQLNCFKVSLTLSCNSVIPYSHTTKVHPFTPIPLSLCAEFLNSHRHLDGSFASQLEHILEVLRSLKRVNNLAEACLHPFVADTADSSSQIPRNNSESRFGYK